MSNPTKAQRRERKRANRRVMPFTQARKLMPEEWVDAWAPVVQQDIGQEAWMERLAQAYAIQVDNAKRGVTLPQPPVFTPVSQIQNILYKQPVDYVIADDLL